MRWIKFENELPKNNQIIIVWGESIMKPTTIQSSQYYLYDELQKQLLTHWMPWKEGKKPLPQPPKE